MVLMTIRADALPTRWRRAACVHRIGAVPILSDIIVQLSSRSATVTLIAEPGIDIVSVVPDVSADPEAAGPGAEVAPVPQRGWRDTQQLGDVGEGEQFAAAAVVVLRLLVHVLLLVGCRLARLAAI
jgi:hypothetical protein